MKDTLCDHYTSILHASLQSPTRLLFNLILITMYQVPCLAYVRLYKNRSMRETYRGVVARMCLYTETRVGAGWSLTPATITFESMSNAHRLVKRYRKTKMGWREELEVAGDTKKGNSFDFTSLEIPDNKDYGPS